MKENDIVVLTKLKDKYKINNLYQNANGIVLNIDVYDKSIVLFLNDKIVGDYAVVEVDNKDIEKSDIILPMDFVFELKNSNKLSRENLFKKTSFDKLEFKECDYVKLIVEDKKYTKHGIHRGDTGVVAIDYAVDNEILVDFSGIDEDGRCYGDCISVNIADIKLIK